MRSIAILFLAASLVAAAPVTTASASGSGSALHWATSMTIQSDGKIVVAGYTGFESDRLAVARYDSNGGFDDTFGSNGSVELNIGTPNLSFFTVATAVAIDASGKIVVAGLAHNGATHDVMLARLDGAGALDPAFGVGGIVQTDLGQNERPASLAIQDDGSIVVVGNSESNLLILRYTDGGALDPTFDADGSLTEPIDVPVNAEGIEVALQSSGRIIVACKTSATPGNLMLRGYDSTGTLDPSFDSDGIATATDSNRRNVAIVLQDDDKIVVANEAGTLWRFDADGAPDTTFDGDGIVSTPLATGVAGVVIRGDGRIIVVAAGGYPYDAYLRFARYQSDGSADGSFGVGGVAEVVWPGATEHYARAVALQPDGKLVTAGQFEWYASSVLIARVNEDGSIDDQFASNGLLRETLCTRVPLSSPSCVDAAKASANLCSKLKDYYYWTRIGWKWRGMETGPIAAASGEASQYALCIYDMSAGVPRLLTWFDSIRDYWNQGPHGWTFKPDDTYRRSMNYARVITPGAPDLPKARVTAQDAIFGNAWLPTPYDATRLFEADPGVIVQLVNSDGLCMKSEFSGSSIARHDSQCLRGR